MIYSGLHGKPQPVATPGEGLKSSFIPSLATDWIVALSIVNELRIEKLIH